MRKLLLAVLPLLGLLGSLPLLTACHTVQGAGEDISATGHAISNGAEKTTP
jgi:predicted small secreted protein